MVSQGLQENYPGYGQLYGKQAQTFSKHAFDMASDTGTRRTCSDTRTEWWYCMKSVMKACLAAFNPDKKNKNMLYNYNAQWMTRCVCMCAHVLIRVEYVIMWLQENLHLPQLQKSNLDAVEVLKQSCVICLLPLYV